jgi:hypothetical protein
MKVITTALFLLVSSILTSSSAIAQVLEVNIWKPIVGKVPLTYEYAMEAKAIQEKLGATVSIASDLDGRMHFALSFDNWSNWAEFGNKMADSKDWAGFIGKINAEPSAELESNYLLNVVSPGEDGPVYQVFVWEANPGQVNTLIENTLEAKAIHEKGGASVGVYVDQLNHVHYGMSFPSWEAWAKFQDTPNPEFQNWMSQQNQNPTATLIKVYTASER